MILKDEMQKRCNKKPILTEGECKSILEDIQNSFLKEQEKNNGRKQFVGNVTCDWKGLYLTMFLEDKGTTEKSLLGRPFYANENEEVITELNEILKDQFTSIRRIKGCSTLQLMIELS